MGAWLTTTLTLLVDAAPYLLGGFLAAGLIHVFLARHPAVTARLTGRGPGAVTWASVLGIPLPLCSCSVLPAGMALRREGAGKGSVASFLVSVPETDIISIVLTYALLGPLMAVFRPLAALLSAISTGLAVEGADRWITEHSRAGDVSAEEEHGHGAEEHDPGAEEYDPGAEEHDHGTVEHGDHSAPSVEGRWWRPALRYGFGDMFDDLLPQLLLGFLIAGAITVWLPALDAEFLQGGSAWSYLAMVLIGAPMYVCATASTPVALGLVVSGVSPGAALVLLLAGPATNVASLVVLHRVFGRVLLAVYLTVLLATSIAAGVAFDGLLSLLGLQIQTSASPEAAFVPTLPPALSVPAALLLLVLAVISLSRTGAIESKVRELFRRAGLSVSIRQARYGLLGVVLLAWLGTGVFVVNPGERAATVRFGQVSQGYVEPGLHYHWPAPLGGVERVPVGRVLRVVVGSESASHEGSGAWALAGDENILDVRAVVHFRIEDSPRAVARWAFGVSEPRAVLERLSEWAVRTAVTRRGIDTLLTVDRGEVEREVREALLTPALERLSLHVAPLEVNLAYVHAPAPVHWSFRDVASSMEEKEERIHRAAADKQRILGKARGEVRARMSRAQARAAEWTEAADGRAHAFTARLEAYQRAPRLTRSRLYLEKLDEVLPKASKIANLVPGASGPDLWLRGGEASGERIPFPPSEPNSSEEGSSEDEDR